MTKLLELFYSKEVQNEKIKKFIASIIGRIFKSKPIPIEFGVTIVNYLKDSIINASIGGQANE